MPLCTLEIPRAEYQAMPSETRDHAAADLCNAALDHTLQILGVPEEKREDDREMRIMIVEGGVPRITISYTVGPHEYPGCEPESFFPPEELVESVLAEIQTEGDKSPFKIVETKTEAYEGSIFVFRPFEPSEPVTPSQLEEFKTIGKHITQPKVTLVLSPGKWSSISFPGREIEPSNENDPYREVAKEISKIIEETLGLSEWQTIETEVKRAHIADTCTSVEFDCQPEPGYSIPKEAREHVAREIAQFLDENRHTRVGTAEIWIRQGEPEIHTQISKK